jgi:MFS family permease
MNLSAIQIARPILGRGRAVPVLAVRSAFVLVVYAMIAVAGALLSFFVALLGWRGLGLFVIGAVLSAVGLMLLTYVLSIRKERRRRADDATIARPDATVMNKVLAVTAVALSLIVISPLFLTLFVGSAPLLGGGLVGYFLLRAVLGYLASARQRTSSRNPRPPLLVDRSQKP